MSSRLDILTRAALTTLSSRFWRALAPCTLVRPALQLPRLLDERDAALHESMAGGENQDKVNDSVNHLADDKLRLRAIREQAFCGGDFELQFFPELVESLDGMAKR